MPLFRSTIALATIALLGGGAAAPALAGDVSIGIQIVSGRPMRTVWVEPVYETRMDRVWTEPEYRTVTEQVWRAPVTEPRIERVWVPDRYGTRDVHYVDPFGRHRVRHETILVAPAHWQERKTELVIRAGYHETVTRQVCVREGGWQTVEHRVLVREGHWATVPAYDSGPIYHSPPPVIIERPIHVHPNRGDRNTRFSDVDRYRERYDDTFRQQRHRDMDSRDRDRNQQRDHQDRARGDRGERYR